MRAKKAAQYIDMTEPDFLRRVNDGDLPSPFLLNGGDAWDRIELDEAIDAIKAGVKRTGSVGERIAQNAKALTMAGRSGKAR